MEKIKYITSLEANNLTRSVAKPLLFFIKKNKSYIISERTYNEHPTIGKIINTYIKHYLKRKINIIKEKERRIK